MKTWYPKMAAGNHQGMVIDEATGRTVAVAYDSKNTPLLAAAPKLLEALRDCLRTAEYAAMVLEAPEKCAMRENIANAKAAIAEATE